ncbi:MAG: type II toxin-antitoxin system CcdA family antitoxin [Idiomarina sp.]|nr:type II toxin-antitoxin system CcdA family antitoxin [Idiomarina sp.]
MRINSDLLSKAKGLNINLSATLEQALAEQIRAGQRNSSKLRRSASSVGIFTAGIPKAPQKVNETVHLRASFA